jgi:UDP-GlcNAc:undecaprenyl-phosphate GlcNAc-1-phosphate transferase
MELILTAFLISFLFSILLTPAARNIGARFGFLDMPRERKMHSKPIPRSGGMVIFAAYVVTVLAVFSSNSLRNELLLNARGIIFFNLGLFLCFGIGLLDDYKRRSYRLKFLVQIIAASLAFYGGVEIDALIGSELHVGWSYIATVFWFLLFINAVNLIDGLDGLAAGICFFASASMVFFCIKGQAYAPAVGFAALAGSLLGFLRYNFNPATIFLGDGGSYLLGYVLAGLSILGSLKTEASALFLIPLLALGVPVFDTLLSPVRRWVLGKAMFKPDNTHIHHQLIRRMGLSTRRAVLTLYGISLLLCVFSVCLIQFRNPKMGLVLIALGLTAAVFVRKLGYFEYLTQDKIFGWIKDVTDVAGLNQDRRSFLSLQVEASKSRSMAELWENICMILERLRFMKGEFHLSETSTFVYMNEKNYESFKLYRPQRGGSPDNGGGNGKGVSGKGGNGSGNGNGNGSGNGNGGFRDVLSIPDGTVHFVWVCPDIEEKRDYRKQDLMRIELPLLNGDGDNHGKLILVKDLKSDPLTPYTIRRLEHLRRTMAETLVKLKKEARTLREIDPLFARRGRSVGAGLRPARNRPETRPPGVKF